MEQIFPVMRYIYPVELSIHSDDFFMNEALKEAVKAYEAGEVPIGAIIVCNKRIIARSFNYTERLNDVTAHAEMQAITAAANYLGGKYLNECVLYVTLEPCVMCAGALSWAQIGGIVYGAFDTRRGFSTMDQKILHPKTKVTGGVKEIQCSDLIVKFFNEQRKL